jgi:hypothetical protein
MSSIGWTGNQRRRTLAIQKTLRLQSKREGPGYPGNVGSHPGTNIQEVLRVLIDRLKYLNNQIPDNHNSLALSDLREALWFLEHRAAERHGRFLKVWPWEIELEPTCRKCGHIGCDGTCHA